MSVTGVDDASTLMGTADSGPAAPLRVLLVDDDDVDRIAVTRALARASVATRLTEAAGGAEAVRLVHEHEFDCVFLDYNIPGSEGLGLLRQLRAARPHLSIVMLTGQGDEQVAVELMKAGAMDYLPKAALSPERLAASLRYAVELGRASTLAQAAEQELHDSALRARFLAAASAALTSTIDPRETIHEVARLVVPFLADFCAVYRLDPAGSFATVAAAPADVALPVRIDIAEAAAGAGVLHEVLRGDQPVLMAGVDSLTLQPVSSDDGSGTPLRPQESHSALLLPLVARRHAQGVLLFVRNPARERFSGPELDVAVDLAERVALAFEHASLYEAAQQARTRTERLQRITASLAAVLPAPELGQLFVQQACEAIAADTAWVALLADDGRQFEMLAQSGYDDRELQRWRRFPMSLDTPVADVAADGVPRWFRDRPQLYAQYPALEDAAPDGPLRGALGVVPLDAGAGVFGVVALGFDAARDFEPEDRSLTLAMAGQFAQALERARLYEAERDARRRAESANRAKSEFLARMSHDLRTPLNAIGGYAELVEIGLQGPVTTQQQEAMFRIRRAKDHLLTLINDILSFAKLEAGQVTITVEDVEVPALAREVRDFIAPQVAARNLRFVNAGGPPLRARADRERLLQVLVNLLTNAVKFTDAGMVEIAWESSEGHVLIRVRDSGRGIAPERLGSIFEPFVQDAPATAEAAEGVGLGLAISRELLRLMNGELSVSSTLGKGSVFTIRLPAA